MPDEPVVDVVTYEYVDHGWAARTAFRDGAQHVAVPVASLASALQAIPDHELLTITHLYGIPVAGDTIVNGWLYLIRRTEPEPQEDTMANRGLRDPDMPRWLTDLGPAASQLLDSAQDALNAAREQLTSPEAKQAGGDLGRTLSATVGQLGKLFTVTEKDTGDSTARPLVHHGWQAGQRVVLVHRSSNQAHPGLVIGTMDTEVTVNPDDGQAPYRLDFDPTTGDFTGPYEVRTPELHQQYLDVEAENREAEEVVPTHRAEVRDLTEVEYLDTLPPSESGIYRWYTGNGYVRGRVHTIWVIADDVRMLWVQEDDSDDDGAIVQVFLRSVTHVEPVL